MLAVAVVGTTLAVEVLGQVVLAAVEMEAIAAQPLLLELQTLAVEAEETVAELPEMVVLAVLELLSFTTQALSVAQAEL
jgi:hypothetical protein